MASLFENIKLLRANIEKACKESNQKPSDITIVAASKTVPAQKLKELKELGINICGENRVQEFVEKYGKVDTDWHFIGRLQTNKVKYIYDKISLLHSLDRISLAEAIEKRCAASNTVLNALIEVNIGGEDNKGGVMSQQAQEFYYTVKQNFAHIRICGVMAVMPAGTTDNKYYLQMKDIYDKIKWAGGEEVKYLSMGMSDDYFTAIKCGANIIRPGRALFGDRV